MEIRLDLALARRLVGHLHTVLADDEAVTLGFFGLNVQQAEDDLIELSRIVWEAEAQDGE